jgi:glucose-6-phosphate isomerase
MRINLSRQPYNLQKLVESSNQIKSYLKDINEVITYKNYQKGESFLLAPFEEKQILSIIDLKKRIPHTSLKKIYVIGIGGSSQGTKAIYELLKNQKKLIDLEVFDYIESEKIIKSISEIKKFEENEYLIFIVSKSGLTTETFFNFELLANHSKVNPQRLVFITDENSHLVKISQNIKAHHLSIPKKISGRFSVFTNCGLAPLAFCGINIVKLLEGAMQQINEVAKEESSALLSAASKFLTKKIINENLYPNRHFGELGKWEKQLFNESLGKINNIPFTSFGNFYLELHSSLQYYLNSKNIYLNTVYLRDSNNLILKKTLLLPKNFDNSDSEEIRRGIYNSVLKEFEKNEIPTVSVEFDGLNEVEVGNYLQYKMLEVYFMARFFDVNPFDQPEVQSYKQELHKYI